MVMEMVSDTVLTADVGVGVGVGVGVAAAVSKDDGSAVGIDDGIRQRQRAPCAVRERHPTQAQTGDTMEV